MEMFSLKVFKGCTFAFEHLYLQILDSHMPYEVAVKCQAMENTYSKNSSVIPRNSLFIGHASNPPYPY
jgi:hypothetical protein